ncbi:hypothetical protein ES703_78092 [subsurface metagenome]
MVVGVTLSCRRSIHDFGNPPGVEWIRVYENYFQGNAVEFTSNGGYAITGETHTSDRGEGKPFLLITNSSGDSVWTIVFEEYEEGSGRDVRQTIDDGYIMVGTSKSIGKDDENIFCIRTDSIGNTIWAKKYAGDKTAYGSSIELTDDDGFIIAGATSSFGIGHENLYLMRIDENGEKLWERTYGEEFRSEAKDIRRTSDGNFIITGWIVMQDYKVYLLKVDNEGNCIWSKKYGCDGNFGAGGWSVKETSDSGYVIIGDATEKSYIIKTDSLGDTLWMKEIGSDEAKTRCLSIEQTADGGYVISGVVSSYIEKYSRNRWDIYVAKTDSIGGIQWAKSMGEQGMDYGCEVRQTKDSGYIIAGILHGDMCLIKLKPEK